MAANVCRIHPWGRYTVAFLVAVFGSVASSEAQGAAVTPPAVAPSAPATPLTRATLAGLYVTWYVTFQRPTGGQEHGYLSERSDTLRLTRNGRIRSKAGSFRYVLRGDSLIVKRQAGEIAYAVHHWPGHLTLSSWTSYDFNADALPETAIRKVVYRCRRGCQ